MRFILRNYLPVNAMKPRRNQCITPEGFKVQTTLSVSKRIPTGIHIDAEEGSTSVEFAFKRLPSMFCSRCRKVGHRLDKCDDDLYEQDDVVLLLEDSEAQ